jgi:TPR repeat protein
MSNSDASSRLASATAEPVARQRRSFVALGFAGLLALGLTGPARADGFYQGRSAFARGDYPRAARLLVRPARTGNARAQAMLGFMYENGFGVPQAYDVAVDLYRRSAEHGDPSGQYLLGLMYDKGHGIEHDVVLAYKWLDLAAAGAPARDRENYTKLRNAVASKMSLVQVEEGQRLAIEWRAR